MFAKRHAVLAAALLAAAPVDAATPQAQQEIEHLLAFVADSNCQFIRNGKRYGPTQARDHLAKKLAAVADRIASAEDFVRHIASASSVTGEPYRVHCPGTPIELSVHWLGKELQRRRAETK
jgi:Family of unknown function (DUF5329)